MERVFCHVGVEVHFYFSIGMYIFSSSSYQRTSFISMTEESKVLHLENGFTQSLLWDMHNKLAERNLLL